jgi:hypothetical protein
VNFLRGFLRTDRHIGSGAEVIVDVAAVILSGIIHSKVREMNGAIVKNDLKN